MVSSIDPKCHGSAVAERVVRKLIIFLTNILDSAEQRDKYDTDDSNFHLVEDIPTYNGKPIGLVGETY